MANHVFTVREENGSKVWQPEGVWAFRTGDIIQFRWNVGRFDLYFSPTDGVRVLGDTVSPVGYAFDRSPIMVLPSLDGREDDWFQTEPARVMGTPREAIDEALQRNAELFVEQFRFHFRLRLNGRTETKCAIWLDRAGIGDP